MIGSDIERRWWTEAVVYQIYPRSFDDTDGDGRWTDGLTSQPERRRRSGDGVGDLPGVAKEGDYLVDLGIDVVRLNPVYESPNADDGYDVSDCRAIVDEFGEMADWERLLEELHVRGCV